MDPLPARIDRDAVDARSTERLDWRHKAIPPQLWGKTVDDLRQSRPRLSGLPTPLFTLSKPAMEHNVRVLSRWCRQRGIDLAPHGKTTMAPQLWAEQIDSGAYGITVANQAQLGVARAFGVSRVVVANTVVSGLGLRWIADQLDADHDSEIIVWADSVRTVELMHAVLAEHARPGPGRPLPVLVERGGEGGRTGTRDLDTAVAVARAVASSPHLTLAGVSGYEAALAHDSDEDSREVVRRHLRELVAVHEELSRLDLYGEVTPLASAGGSAYFELVAEVLGPLVESGTRVVLRSGAYIAHDHGFYRHVSPLGSAPRTEGATLRPAMHGWVRVTSRPEPGMAVFDAGKRDLPFDEGLPEVQLRRPREPGGPPIVLDGVSVTAVDDQHGFLRFDADGDPPLRIGDELRLGLSHPCTAFDKWSLVPVLDDPDTDDPTVVDFVRTWF